MHALQNITNLLGPITQFGNFWGWGGGGSACRFLGITQNIFDIFTYNDVFECLPKIWNQPSDAHEDFMR